MTKLVQLRLRVFSFVVLMLSILFYLEGGGKPGWKSGVALLMLSILCGIDLTLTSSKVFRFLFAAFSLCFLVFSIRNFLAH